MGLRSKAGFWNRIAKKYARQPIVDETTYQKKLDATRELLTTDSRVIELGAGTGSTALLHAPYAAHIHLVDISDNMLDIARQKVRDAGIENLSFEQADLDHYHYAGEPVDIVMAMSLLHLLNNKDALLEECYTMLKPGGYFVSSTICMKDGFGFMRPLLAIARVTGLVPTVRFFSQEDLLASIRQAGFQVEDFWRPAPKAATFIVARKPA